MGSRSTIIAIAVAVDNTGLNILNGVEPFHCGTLIVAEARSLAALAAVGILSAEE